MKMKNGLFAALAWVTLAALNVPAAAVAQDAGDDIFAQYREMFGDDNPAELIELQGEDLWSQTRGPKKASLEQCDLGLGPGKLDGAYARLPRYFADTKRVMDLETRLIHCMVTLQGFAEKDLVAKPFSGRGDQPSDLEALSAFIAGRSRGTPIEVSQAHAQERAAYERGKAFFFYRAGPHDFSCATCHSQSGKRIRLQALPNLTEAADARKAYATWPGYRISEGTVRTMEWRMGDCARQQRLPELQFGSDIAIGLITYLGVMANGEPMNAPGLKR